MMTRLLRLLYQLPKQHIEQVFFHQRHFLIFIFFYKTSNTCLMQEVCSWMTLSRPRANFLHQTCIAGLLKHLSPYTGRISEWTAFATSFCPQETNNRTLLFVCCCRLRHGGVPKGLCINKQLANRLWIDLNGLMVLFAGDWPSRLESILVSNIVSIDLSICIRNGVFEFSQESYFLSGSQVDDIISFLACEWLYVI